MIFVYFVCFSAFAQRGAINNVESLELNISNQPDEFHRSINDHNKNYRYSKLKIISHKIKKSGFIRVKYRWIKTRIDVRRKYVEKHMLKTLRRPEYSPSKLHDLVYRADCTDSETLILTIKAKILDPLEDLRGETFIRYTNKTVVQNKRIDTKKFCNGYVPLKVVINSN